MATIKEMIKQANADGYFDENAEAKVCQDIVLKALSLSSLCRNATIKGGVVMRSISNDARRATQDMDIDFIRYSLENDSIRKFIDKLNCLENIKIEQVGDITELKQQDYHGKRIYVIISDDEGFSPLVLIAFENLVDGRFVELGCQQADEPYYGESAYHGDGAAVDGVDGIAQQRLW